MVLLFAVFAGFSASAQQKKSKNVRYTFEVQGNCGQCKKRIEKAAFGVDGVKMAMWDQESAKLTVLLNEEKTSLAEVQKAVAKAGHDNEGQRATDDDYANLHSCCKYERKKE